MSNYALVSRIREVIGMFEEGKASFVHLQDILENTAPAIEAIPYSMRHELRSIEGRLAIERGYEEEDCESRMAEVVRSLKNWLERVPC